ncbi:MAG: tetratricopeptide repeat protein [Bacteroidota bacterium]
MNNDRLEQLFLFQKDSPNDPFILFAIAKEYEKRQEQDKALGYYKQLVLEHADYVGTYYHLGKLYEQLHQVSDAFFTYKKGMEVAREAGDQHALNELAGAKLMLGDDDDFE